MEELFPGIWHAPNLHPLFVHAPVTLLPLSLAFMLLGVLFEKPKFVSFGRWCVWIGAGAMLPAVATGLWASEQLGHDAPGHDLVHTHRDIMLIATGLGIAAAVVAWIERKFGRKWLSWLLIGLLSAANIVMVFGADRGAELVFRHGTGTIPGIEAVEEEAEHRGHSHEH